MKSGKIINHLRSAQICTPLSDDLKEKYNTKSIRVRKNDTVKVLRGEFKGVEGKVKEVFVKDGRISVEGVTREKVAGGTIPIKIHASKVMITNLNLEDKWRKKKIDKKEVNV
jgi:large subunit ribosomal protein L24